MAQTQVNIKQAFGVVGDFYDDSPRRVDPYIVAGGSIGQYFTISTDDPKLATVGGAGIPGGIAVNSKEYALAGLSASLTFANGAIAQLCSMGRVVVAATTAVTIGQTAFYNTTTGAIAAGTAGAEMAGHKEIVGSKFVLVNALAGEVSVLQLG